MHAAPLSLFQPASEVFVPDGSSVEVALGRTTHLGIGAHPDDLEIMAIAPILECRERADRFFTGIVVTDGVGSHAAPGRSPLNATALREARRAEQKRAAELGGYGAVVFLDHPSAFTKDPAEGAVTTDLEALLRATRPSSLYTHNLADAHDTHVAVALRVLAACRSLEPAERPARVIGCEVWRGLDWLAAEDKVAMPADGHEELQARLIALFQTQLEGGKRYDLAALGRRRANATFLEMRAPDRHDGIVWGMDLTAAAHGRIEPLELFRERALGFAAEVEERMRRLGG